MGFKISVYQDRVICKEWYQEQSIPISQIASVNLTFPGLQRIIFETTGGREISMPIKFWHKKKVRDAIYQAKAV